MVLRTIIFSFNLVPVLQANCGPKWPQTQASHGVLLWCGRARCGSVGSPAQFSVFFFCVLLCPQFSICDNKTVVKTVYSDFQFHARWAKEENSLFYLQFRYHLPLVNWTDIIVVIFSFNIRKIITISRKRRVWYTTKEAKCLINTGRGRSVNVKGNCRAAK